MTVYVAAAHGGCGTSTLVERLVGAAEIDLRRPPHPSADDAAALGPPPPRISNTTGARCCVVAATTPDGTAAATACLQQLRALVGEACPLHLVLVSDGRGPVPVAVKARVRVLHPHLAGVHLLPHVHRWRYQAHGSRTPSPRYDRAVRALSAALAPQAATASPSRRPAPAPAPTFGNFPAYPMASATGATAGGTAAW